MTEKVKVSREVLKKKNVVGYSNFTHERATLDKDLEEVIPVYVIKKEPEAQLKSEDVIEREIDGIKTDVIELGSEPSIFSSTGEEGHREEVDVLTPGCSIGNIGITAGTLGWFAKKNGKEYLRSNSHVFCDYPHKNSAVQTQIIQPGVYDGGSKIVGYYDWHLPLKPTVPILDYPLSWWEQWLYNVGIIKEPEIPEGWETPVNNTDFAVARKLDEIPVLYETMDFPVSYNYDYVGDIFAGTLYTSLICKVGYQLELGYEPMYVDVATIEKNDRVRKSGRTTGDTEKWIIDKSCDIVVNYGYFKALLGDVAMALKMSEGGDSGSAVWKKKQ
jgi:hypothetical protein